MKYLALFVIFAFISSSLGYGNRRDPGQAPIGNVGGGRDPGRPPIGNVNPGYQGEYVGPGVMSGGEYVGPGILPGRDPGQHAGGNVGYKQRGY